MPRLSRVLAVALLCGPIVVGCGDDDDGGTAGTSGGGQSGSDASVSGNGGSGGGGLPRRDAGESMEGDEGWPCTRTQPCNADFVCAATPFAINGQPVGVCGVPCENNAECDGGQCITYSGSAVDAHCVNVIDTEYELCGVADTSVCSDELTCLYFPDFPLGVCVSLCNTGAGGDDDAGMSTATMCSGSQACVEGVLADPAPGEGVCGTLVQRGDECGLEMGRYCGDGDVCGPEDPADQMSAQRCYQDCSVSGTTCETGQCTIVENRIAYCL